MPSQSWASGFDGTHSAAPAFAGQATFGGCLAVVPVDRRTLQSRLPPSISLPQGDADECPCLLVFGEQADGKTFFGGMSVPLGLRYHELMVAIPFAGWDRVPGDHLFVAGMVCDFWPAVWNGNTHWGFSKRFAPMSWDGARLFVQNDDGEVDFWGAVSAVDRTSGEAFDWIRSAAALPVLGVRRDGVFVKSRFEWDFHGSRIDRAALRLATGPRFRELGLVRDSMLSDSVYHVRDMKWRLTWPQPHF
jgi:hypothetical protein